MRRTSDKFIIFSKTLNQIKRNSNQLDENTAVTLRVEKVLVVQT